MDNSTLAIDNSKRRHTSSPHTSSQLDEHAGLRHTDTSRSGLVTGTPARNHRAIIRWWIVSCISFLVYTPLVSVLLGLHPHSRDFQYLDNNFTFPGRTVRLFFLFCRSNSPARVDPLASPRSHSIEYCGHSHLHEVHQRQEGAGMPGRVPDGFGVLTLQGGVERHYTMLGMCVRPDESYPYATHMQCIFVMYYRVPFITAFWPFGILANCHCCLFMLFPVTM